DRAPPAETATAAAIPDRSCASRGPQTRAHRRQSRPQRPLPLRQRQEVQEMLRHRGIVQPVTKFGMCINLGNRSVFPYGHLKGRSAKTFSWAAVHLGML